MLLSMTGYGEARLQRDDLSITVDVRALNNRYLKISFRSTEPYTLLEPEIEKAMRRVVRRGTIHVQLRVYRQPRPQDFRLNAVALRSYLEQIQGIQGELASANAVPLAAVLALPGVVVAPNGAPFEPEADWPAIEKVFQEALAKFQAMRQEEGKAMERELLGLRDRIAEELESIRTRAPQVVENYRDKLHERIRGLLAELDIEIDRSELIKEVSIFAERSDIAEEIVRLASHLDQFREILKEPESPGRKLDFLTQEMFRETNTIGSKASDVEIARHVVEIKGAIEKIRELVQNIE